MELKDNPASAIWAAATAEQRQFLVDVVSGRRSPGGRAFDLLMIVFVLCLTLIPFLSAQIDMRFIALAAAFGVLSAYIALSVQMQHRFRALVRLLERGNE